MSDIAEPREDCDRRGTIVTPECPPMTGTAILVGLEEVTSPRKREARTTSRVVTPKRREGSKTPCASSVLATMGTVEFTGLEITRMRAFGETLAIAVASDLTIVAFV